MMMNLQKMTANRQELTEGKYTLKITGIEERVSKANESFGIVAGCIGEKKVECLFSQKESNNGNSFFENAITDLLEQYGMESAISKLAETGLEATTESISALLAGMDATVYVVKTRNAETGEVFTNYHFSKTREVSAMLRTM